MASLATKRAISSFRLARARIIQARNISLSAPAQKQKGKVGVEDDLFVEDAVVEDLFADPSSGSKSGSQNAAASEPAPKAQLKRKLNPQERTARFDQNVEFVKSRIGRKPAQRTPQIRLATWTNLIDLAASEGELRQVVELFPGWTDSGHEMRPLFAEQFARRCDQLACPSLTIEVFGNFSKYNLKLTLSATQWLFHSLRGSVDKLSVTAELASVHGLQSVAQDIVTASILAASCLKNGAPESKAVAEELIPSLKKMVQETQIFKSQDDETRKKAKWVLGSLRTINRELGPQLGPLHIPLEQDLRTSQSQKATPTSS